MMRGTRRRLVAQVMAVTIVLLAFWPSPVCADNLPAVTWTGDGRVFRAGRSVRTELQSVSVAHPTADGIYLAGYKIDAKGVNYPRLIYVSGDLRTTKSWPFAESIAQVFSFRGGLHVLD